MQQGYRLLQENGFRAPPVCDEGELVGLLNMEDIGRASLLRQLTTQGGALWDPLRTEG